MPLPAEQVKLIGQIANASRWDPDRADEKRRELKEIRATEYIQKIASSWPPLTDAQRARLAAILWPTSVTTTERNA